MKSLSPISLLTMKDDWVLTQGAFNTLLDWLDADPERAGRKYEAIRLRLIRVFACRGCHEPEELANETINRVTARVVEVARRYNGDPALYFYGVSQKVLLEHLRTSQQKLVSADQQSIIASEQKPAPLRPPFNGEYLLYLLIRREERDPVIGDFIEGYGRVFRRFNKRRADIWFYKQVAGSVLPLLRRALLRIGTLVWLGRILRRLIS